MSQKIVASVFRSLQPTFEDMVDDAMFSHWTEYGSCLDDLEWMYDEGGDDAFIHAVNGSLKNLISSTPDHQAATDVATTLESLLPERFAGKFKY